MMTKQESLNILNSVYEQMKSMTEEELFDYLMMHSESFRNDVADFKNTIELTGHNCFKGFKDIYIEKEAIFSKSVLYSEGDMLTEDNICQIAA